MINLKYKFWLVAGLGIIGLSMYLMNQKNTCFSVLPKQFSPKASVVALEFIKTGDDLIQILENKDEGCTSSISERLDHFHQSLRWDTLFVIGYGLLFYLLTYFFIPANFRSLKIVAWIIIVLSCFCDFVENHFLAQILDQYIEGIEVQTSIDWMFKFAFSKWSLLFLLSMLLGYLSLPESRNIYRNIFLWAYGISLLVFLFLPVYPLQWIGNTTQWMIFLNLILWAWLIIRSFFK